MSYYKRAANDEGIFNSPHGELFEFPQDVTTPQSRADLVDQAFLTNAGIGDPTTEAPPPAVNPSLTGPLRGAGRVDELPLPAKKTDEMGGGMGERDVVAAYHAGRRDALMKFARQMSSATTAASRGGTQLSPKTQTPSNKGGSKGPAAPPTTPDLTGALKGDGVANGVTAAIGHAGGSTLGVPAAPAAPNTGNTATARSAATPQTVAQKTNTSQFFAGPQSMTVRTASLNTRSDYGREEPTRYSVPPDNGQSYSPRTNLDKKPEREVNKAFNDLGGQPNADALNEAGQAAIGVIG